MIPHEKSLPGWCGLWTFLNLPRMNCCLLWSVILLCSSNDSWNWAADQVRLSFLVSEVKTKMSIPSAKEVNRNQKNIKQKGKRKPAHWNKGERNTVEKNGKGNNLRKVIFCNTKNDQNIVLKEWKTIPFSQKVVGRKWVIFDKWKK